MTTAASDVATTPATTTQISSEKPATTSAETTKTVAHKNLLARIGKVVFAIFVVALPVAFMAAQMNLFLGTAIYALYAKKVVSLTTVAIAAAFAGNLAVLDVFAFNTLRGLFSSKTAASVAVPQ